MLVAEAIQLLGIDGEYRVVLLQPRVHNQDAWNLDGNGEFRGFAIGQRLQEITELNHVGATMFDTALADLLPFASRMRPWWNSTPT
jgi:hypothetical protein